MSVASLNGLGQEIFEKRYAYPGEKNWAERARVIAKTAAGAERDEDKERVEQRFYESLSSGDLVPGGRIIYGSGRNAGRQNLLNCYVINPQDSVESIGKTIQDMYKISCAGGGIGFNFSDIRPKGDHIQQQKNSAPGSVSVMRMLNEIGNHVRAGKNRRTALIAILNVTHPDLLEFLHVKLDMKELNNFNISVGITDRFIEACKNNEDWYFTFANRKYHIFSVQRKNDAHPYPEYIDVVANSAEDAMARAREQHKIHFTDDFVSAEQKPLKAKQLWDMIWLNSVQSGDPGIFNLDLANRHTNVSYFEEMRSTNPCGEIPLPNYGNCCLGNINLANMVTDGEFDWKKFARTVRTGIQFLDNILEVNYFPTPECREVGHRSRRIGLGVLGYHYMLIKLGIRYGSEKCIELTERIAMAMRDIAYIKSTYLARDKGAFPAFDRKKYLDEGFARTLPARIRLLIKEHGIRNAVMLTIPPTGTISMLWGVSSGIEPMFAPIYIRRYRDANVWKEVVVVDPLLREYFDGGKSIEGFVGAYDITPEQHLAVQAAWQKYIDSSISKTINLPKEAKAEDLTNVALDYVEYLKGLTIYRAGSKGNEPLEAVPMTPENIAKYVGNREGELGMADGAACSMNGGECGA
jgi:ribonucleoside-diphosphate reductase alpha chain